jgi:hypothetical protein
MANISPAEYVTYFDSSDIPAVLTTWTLTSPDATIWGPAITTAGIVTFVSGASAGGSAVFIGLDGNKWTPSIANTGIVTVTSGGAMSASDNVAELTDSNSVNWVFYVDDNSVVQVTTAAVLPTLLRYPALIVTYTPTASTDVWNLHSARVNITPRRKSS